MSTLVRRADLLDVELPKAVWSRSGRPTLGRISRTLFASTLVLLGLAMPWPAVSFGLLIAGVAGFVLIPVITDLIIERGEGAFRRATAADADAKLASLDQRVLISAFAPDAWVTLQRARLQLAKGDGRAAAAFASSKYRCTLRKRRGMTLSSIARSAERKASSIGAASCSPSLMTGSWR